MRKWLRVVMILVGVLAAVVAVLAFGLRHSPVPVTAGPAADALAREIERSIDVGAWARTRAVRWTAKGGREHLWDRERGYARVRFSGHEVLLDLARKSGRAWTGGQDVVDPTLQRALLDKAHRWHVNDSFWLNPLAKLFDDGVTRSLGTLDGKRVLEVHYASGGVTPGDRYQWIVDTNARPERWRVWASVLPVAGAEFSWEGWRQLETGAWISTDHKALGRSLVTVTDVSAGTHLRAIEAGDDPFEPLASHRE